MFVHVILYYILCWYIVYCFESYWFSKCIEKCCYVIMLVHSQITVLTVICSCVIQNIIRSVINWYNFSYDIVVISCYVFMDFKHVLKMFVLRSYKVLFVWLQLLSYDNYGIVLLSLFVCLEKLIGSSF